MKLSRKDARTITKFRRSPYARVIKDAMNRELRERRHKFETTLADEGQRGYIQALKAVEDVLFDQNLEVGNEDANS